MSNLTFFKDIFKPKLNRILILFILLVFLLTICSGIFSVPYEDAAITYKYSKNLAETGIISYIPGGERAEGATDFAWMIIISVLQKLNIGNHLAAALLNLFFLIIFFIRIFNINKLLKNDNNNYHTNVLVSFSSFLLIIFVTGISISGLGGFATLAQISLLAIIFTSFIFKEFDKIFIFSSSFFILLRPDSIAYYLAIIIPFCVVYFLDLLNIQEYKKLIIDKKNKIRSISKKLENDFNIRNFIKTYRLTLLPLILFLVYWPLRALYFGKAYPLPYYVKQVYENDLISIIHRFAREITTNGINNISISIVLIIGILLISFDYEYRKINSSLEIKNTSIIKDKNINQISIDKKFWLSCFFCWAFFLVTQSLYLSRFHLQQNIWDRFHAPLLAITASFLASFLLIYPAKFLNHGRKYSISVILLALLFLTSFNVTLNGGYMGLKRIAVGYKYFFNAHKNDNIFQLSRDLGELNTNKKIDKILLTEAGRIPYYSGIPAIDTWGLNTPRYALNPLQDPSDIAKEDPDIINMHTNLNWLVEAEEEFQNNKSFKVGRKCIDLKPSEPKHLCGFRQVAQAIFVGANKLDYEIYVVPVLKDLKNKKYQLWMINPESYSLKDIRIVLLNRNAVRINSVQELKEYAW